jgi:Major tropism determinant N-terminal domain
MATRMQQRRGTAAQWTGANPTLAAGEIGYETDTGKFKIGNGSSAWGALNYYVDANAILDGAPGVLDTLNELAAALGDDPAFITTVGTNLSNHTNATTSVHGIADTADLATQQFVTDAVSNAEVDQSTLAGAGIDWNSGTGQFDIDSTVVTLDGVQTLTNKTLDSNTVATTQLLADSSTKVATTEFVHNRLAALIDNAPSTLDTLNELAAALADDENFAATIATDIGNLTTTVDGKLSLSGGTMAGTIILQADPINVNDAATKNYVDNTSTTAASGAVSSHNALTTNVHGIADVGELATESYVGDEIDTHALATNVHGIADAISDHNSANLNVHGIADTSALALSSEIEDHRLDTTSVHGIADTADLVLTGDARLSDTRTPTDNTVSTDKIVNSAVTADKLAGDSVTTAKIEDGAVTSAKIADGTIVNADINASAAIEMTKIDGLGSALDLKAPLADPTFTGTVSGITKSMVGLGNVDNTSDADKPVSTATQTALDAKASLSGATFTGSVEIDQNLTVDGNLTVNGTTFNASATSITIEDNMVQLAHQNAANTVDLGIVVAYTDGTAKHAGIVRDVSDAKWKLFKDVSTEPSTTVAFGEGSLDALAVGALEATTVTPSSGVVFSDGTQTKEGVPSRTPIIQKTAAYTLGALTERDSLIEVSHTGGSAVSVTIPADSTLNFPIGTSIDVLQTNTGSVAIAAGSGVTVNATPGLTLRTQWSSATLLKRAANTWVVYGDLK